jgi:hypothetical protein
VPVDKLKAELKRLAPKASTERDQSGPRTKGSPAGKVLAALVNGPLDKRSIRKATSITNGTRLDKVLAELVQSGGIKLDGENYFLT